MSGYDISAGALIQILLSRTQCWVQIRCLLYWLRNDVHCSFMWFFYRSRFCQENRNSWSSSLFCSLRSWPSCYWPHWHGVSKSCTTYDVSVSIERWKCVRWQPVHSVMFTSIVTTYTAPIRCVFFQYYLCLILVLLWAHVLNVEYACHPIFKCVFL